MPLPKPPILSFKPFLPLALLAALTLCACTVLPALSASPDVRYNEWFPDHFKRMDARDYFEADPQLKLANAAARGNTKEIESAIAEGADVNHVGRNGMASLFWAMGKQNQVGFRALLEHGADPHTETPMPTGWRPPYESALSLAAKMESPEYLRALLDHGADPNMIINDGGETAAFRAIMNRRDENMRLLLERGANINHQAEFGGTPLKKAVGIMRFDIAQELLRSGADPTLGRTMRFVSRFLERDNDDPLKSNPDFLSFIAELERRGYIKADE